MFNARCLGLKQSAFKGLSNNKGFVAIAITILVGSTYPDQISNLAATDSSNLQSDHRDNVLKTV
ncbi:hypothetical protein [Halotia branconii]|uniref:Uncharacterized protein n=1 Tax=Halotia branconii CENA392 TaxID=1539056 RepID=A0AAJ6PA58_9CYAN|nr:hypothetical protein [Halotia branconii]WGV26397.1 hypothetical protein QI031_02465 [Halotia branconii CENA392]